MTRWLIAVGVGLALSPGVHAQDGLRSASLPERPVATLPPGPADLFSATPNTYRPRNRPVPPPHDGRGSRPVRPEHPISGFDRQRWPSTGWGYWPYYPDDSEPLDTQRTGVE